MPNTNNELIAIINKFYRIKLFLTRYTLFVRDHSVKLPSGVG